MQFADKSGSLVKYMLISLLIKHTLCFECSFISAYKYTSLATRGDSCCCCENSMTAAMVVPSTMFKVPNPPNAETLVSKWFQNLPVVKKPSVMIRFMILRPLTTRGHPLTTWTLALHSLLHSTSDYNSHHLLHWRHSWLHWTHSWLHWSHSLLKPWTSSLSLPSFVERLASPRC